VLASQCTLTYEDVESSGRVWLSTRGIVRNTAGVLSGLFGISRDITARKRREEEQARELELRERFMSILAHDLSSPIAAIRLSTQLLLSVGGLSPAQRASLGRIEASAERATEMTRQLLDFAHIRYGKGLPVKLAPMNLEAVCHQVIAEFKVTHPERHIQLVMEGEGWGYWDVHRMAQALSNLIGNALEHGDGAGPIRVRVREEGGMQRLEVHNTGEPIARELVSSIFEPFRRGAASGRSRSGGGLGLGLYIVREITRSLHGTVEVRSSEEEGTTFVLSIPREVPAKPRAHARSGWRTSRLKLWQA
jgi:signal transduction histidine kinase